MIWSTIAAALLSDVALFIVIIIDNKLEAPTVLPLPKLICKVTFDNGERKRWQILRTALIDYILCAADNMGILGTSLLISAYLSTFLTTNASNLSALNYQDNYFTAVVYSCCLASCTHIASLLAIKGHLKGHKTSIRVRIGLFSLFAIALCVTIDLNEVSV